MNEFQFIQSGQGLLKNDYEVNDPVANALRMRRKKQQDKISDEMNEATEKP